MFEIQLKFYNRYWSNYFGTKKYTQKKATELFTNLIKRFPDSQWRLVYKEKTKKEKKEKVDRKDVKS